jgi:16S rRNA G966 N2-methylase RsmD
VVFVDASRASLQLVNQNIEQTGFAERSQAVLSKVASFLKKPSGSYDIVFLDPPYADEMHPLLELIAGAGILKPDSIVIAEHFKKQPSPANAGGLTLYREAKYGDTVLAFYKFRSQETGVRSQQEEGIGNQ